MKIFNKIFYTLIALILIFFLYNVITKNKIEINKTDIITGKFKSIHKNKRKGKISFSYNLEIENNSKVLKIIPEYTKCFNYKQFISDVKPNENIELRIDNKDKMLFNNIKSIVSIRHKSNEYINIDCVNESNQKDKVRIPLILIGGIIFIVLLIIIKKRLGIKID